MKTFEGMTPKYFRELAISHKDVKFEIIEAYKKMEEAAVILGKCEAFVSLSETAVSFFIGMGFDLIDLRTVDDTKSYIIKWNKL
jgi:hypothetical protein